MWEFPNVLTQLDGEPQPSDSLSFFKDELGLALYKAEDRLHSGSRTRNPSKAKSMQQIKIINSIELEDPVVHIFSHQRHSMIITLHEVEIVGTPSELNNEYLLGSRKVRNLFSSYNYNSFF